MTPSLFSIPNFDLGKNVFVLGVDDSLSIRKVCP